jgi:hypothetical protein
MSSEIQKRYNKVISRKGLLKKYRLTMATEDMKHITYHNSLQEIEDLYYLHKDTNRPWGQICRKVNGYWTYWGKIG